MSSYFIRLSVAAREEIKLDTISIPKYEPIMPKMDMLNQNIISPINTTLAASSGDIREPSIVTTFIATKVTANNQIIRRCCALSATSAIGVI